MTASRCNSKVSVFVPSYCLRRHEFSCTEDRQNKTRKGLFRESKKKIGRMALPPAYDPESGAAPVSERKSSRKALAVAAGVAVAMVVCVAMLAGKQDSQRTELVIAGSTPDRSLDELAMHMLKHAATMPEKDMWNLLKAWRNNPNTILSSLDPSVKMGNKFDAQSELSEMMGDGPVGVRTQMLVGNLRYCFDAIQCRVSLCFVCT